MRTVDTQMSGVNLAWWDTSLSRLGLDVQAPAGSPAGRTAHVGYQLDPYTEIGESLTGEAAGRGIQSALARVEIALDTTATVGCQGWCLMFGLHGHRANRRSGPTDQPGRRSRAASWAVGRPGCGSISRGVNCLYMPVPPLIAKHRGYHGSALPAGAVSTGQATPPAWRHSKSDTPGAGLASRTGLARKSCQTVAGYPVFA